MHSPRVHRLPSACMLPGAFCTSPLPSPPHPLALHPHQASSLNLPPRSIAGASRINLPDLDSLPPQHLR
eukprot:359139-Chlamydomonas_euryale.AAC.21